MPRTLSKSVGDGGFNQVADVSTVQDLLNLVPSAQGGPSSFLNVDGLAFGKTQDAIRRFQRVALGMAAPDGRVDPGGRTLTKLQGFESRGSTRFVITRFELRKLPATRTADVPDRFYSITAAGGTRSLLYFFSQGTDRLGNASDVLSKLGAQPNESTTFSTKLVHSVAAFQAKDALHSERPGLTVASNRTALSLPIPGDLQNIIITHRWINAPATGISQDLRGQFRPVTEFTPTS